ncbi:hybrid sensor histidine kinase/response regulator [Exilibacterium tricleocarpae]|uniref:histidine kinase n=1 Tax=Exilibacterium tricleocarpae TaxID=2591008 RepID=A0A545TZD8_9GAMM|nr:PAS domain-containing hybrid sensor histidine kinase/response regulator [Exilibacterium tricleocarpae]TQV82579.1 hybrid sensor histidine kinase/response regulator [Exilibacterium tricleocarpae]
MFDPIDILLLSLGYLMLLFGIAHLGDRLPEQWVRKAKPLVIALAGTYTTAWMFFGTPAQAVNNGWYIPPTFFGSIIVLLAAPHFLTRLIRASNDANSTSIADFIASRYGKSQALAVLITAVAIIAVLPYIALQLKAVAMSYGIITDQAWQGDSHAPVWQDTALYVALLMAVFTIMFGTRHIDSNEHHKGLMLAIAFEAIVKIFCFVAIGYFTCFVLFDGIEDVILQAAKSPQLTAMIEARDGDSGFLAATVLGMAALFCLPRQFHILMVESDSPDTVRTLRWLIPVYLLIIAFFILPIGYGGFLLLHQQGLDPETFSLQLPLTRDQSGLTLLAYIGGLSAGSSMVIVTCVALATMVCNHIVMPLLLRSHLFNVHRRGDMTGLLRLIRRSAIVVLLLLAYGYYRLLGGFADLGSIGLLALVLVAQFAPAIVAALYWRRGHQLGVIAGVAAGLAVWFYTLLVPVLVRGDWLPARLLEDGLFGLAWLRPEQLFNLTWSPLSNAVCWSLLANVLTFIGLSLRYSRRHTAQLPPPPIPIARLRDIATRFLGTEQANLALQAYEQRHPRGDGGANPVADEAYQAFVENLLAGVIGASSAQQVLLHARQDSGTGSPQLLLQETSQVFQYGRELLQASVDNISQGISVVDQNLQLVAWNRPYLALFDYPADMIHVGRHVADLVRYNAERGECGPGAVETHVRKRIEHMRRGSRYVFQRTRRDGTVLEIRGNPMPGGGFVTTYTDITDASRALAQLKNAKTHLEERVQERTAQLARAKQVAETANAGKTRFLAAAGHDLVQPLNASRLFISALQQRPLDTEARSLVEQLADSAQAAENLINALLDIAKLDAGAVQANLSDFAVDQVLSPLASDFTALAREKGLRFDFQRCRVAVKSDHHLLRRILQNLLSNALRYTRKGRIVLGCRRRAGALSIEVWDTGIGIDAGHLDEIFMEFKRLDDSTHHEGLGLGLASVRRLCQLLDHRIEVKSTSGAGSVFRVLVPLSHNQAAGVASTPEPRAATVRPHQQLQGRRVLCLDNDPAVLSGLSALLASWDCEVVAAGDLAQAGTALQGVPPDVVVADYHLNGDENGIDAALALFQDWGEHRPCIVISADRTEKVRARAQQQGFLFLRKPVKPAALRASLNHAALRRRAQGS